MRPPADALIHGLKYEGWKLAARVMAERMVSLVGSLGLPDPLSPQILVPVPTTKRRERKRGYNQSRVLAEALSERVGFPVVDALERRPGGETQVSLHRSERLANVLEAFSVPADEPPGLRGGTIILVDDVLTTGATVCGATLALEEAEPKAVTVVTFARSLPRLRRLGTHL